MSYAAMKVSEEVTRGGPVGYRVARTTIALAAASSTFRAVQDDEVRRAIEAVQAANYDFDRLPDETLEHVYATLDDEMMSKVKAEFEFVPGHGCLTDYGTRGGICMLCGKGDSRDDGANEDKLRYAYKLTNLSGGESLWVGSTCIINHALKVRGAETAEDARRILEKSMREHLAMWKIEQWRATNPDHVNIREQFERLKDHSRRLGYLNHQRKYEAAILLAGSPFAKTPVAVKWGVVHAFRLHVEHVARQFATTTRFYQRRGHVTPKKMDSWRKARAMLYSLNWLFSTMERANQEVPYPGPERVRWFEEQRRIREQKLAARKRTPSGE